MGIKLFLADDHKMMIDGLRLILEQVPDMEVVGDADNGRSAAEAVFRLRPDVVLMDITMPEMSGIEAIRKIAGTFATTKILVLSMHSDKGMVTEALGAGASGYLLKECAAEELIEAIRTVVSGEVFVCRKITGIILKQYMGVPGKKCSAPVSLTPRESEILKLIAEGNNTKEIAFTIMVSVKTVETFRRLIMRKLNLYNVVELTKYAIREGMVDIN